MTGQDEASPAKSRARLRPALPALIIWLGLAVYGVLTAASFFGLTSSLFELLSHFRLLFFIVGLFLVAVFALTRAWKFFAVALLIFLLNVPPVAALYIVEEKPPEAAGGPHVRILQLNVWGGKNHDFSAAEDFIREQDADIVGISEITAIWWQYLKEHLPEYPYRLAEPTHGGVALLSKFRLNDAELRYYGEIRRPRIIAHMTVGKQPLTVLFAHPVVPISKSRIRNGELEVLAQETADARRDGSTILFGDLNCTPWSPYFERLLVDGKLRDTERGFGLQPSWCAFMPVQLLPIDHCLMSADLRAVKRSLGRSIGSDHLPVFVELEFVAQPTVH